LTSKTPEATISSCVPVPLYVFWVYPILALTGAGERILTLTEPPAGQEPGPTRGTGIALSRLRLNL